MEGIGKGCHKEAESKLKLGRSAEAGRGSGGVCAGACVQVGVDVDTWVHTHRDPPAWGGSWRKTVRNMCRKTLRSETSNAL